MMGLVLNAYNPSTWEMKAKVLEIQGQSRLHSKFEARGGYMRSRVKKKKSEQQKKTKQKSTGPGDVECLVLIPCMMPWAYLLHNTAKLGTAIYLEGTRLSVFARLFLVLG